MTTMFKTLPRKEGGNVDPPNGSQAAAPGQDGIAQTNSCVDAVKLHYDAMLRLTKRHQGKLHPRSFLTFASIFYGDRYVFSRVEIGGVPKFSRWRIDRGELTPFFVPERELPGMVSYLHTKQGLPLEDLPEILNMNSDRISAALAKADAQVD